MTATLDTIYYYMIPKRTIDEDSKLVMSIKGWWAMIVSIFIFAITLTTFQLNIQHKIETIHSENIMQHSALMEKISTIEARTSYFVLKSKLEEALLFTYRNLNTNNLSIGQEFDYRNSIKEILKQEF